MPSVLADLYMAFPGFAACQMSDDSHVLNLSRRKARHKPDTEVVCVSLVARPEGANCQVLTVQTNIPERKHLSKPLFSEALHSSPV